MRYTTKRSKSYRVSKAKLLEDITKQIKDNYEMQIVNLNDKLQNNKELSEQQLQIASTQIDELKSQLANKTSLQYVIWLLVILTAAIGVLIGKGCN